MKEMSANVKAFGVHLGGRFVWREPLGLARLIVLHRQFVQTKGILRPKNGLRMTVGGCMANGMCVPFYCFQEETLNIKRLWIAQWQEILGASDGLAYAAQEFLKVGVAFYEIDIVGVDH